MYSVLLLDDNVDLQGVLKEVIEMLGYRVIAVDNGSAGLEILESADALPDIVICDIAMPDIDGFEFLKRIRSREAWQKIFFVSMSGSNEDKKPALANGADAYLPKPFNVTELRAVLAQFHARHANSSG